MFRLHVPTSCFDSVFRFFMFRLHVPTSCSDFMFQLYVPILHVLLFFKLNFCIEPYVPREPRRDSSNRRLCAHGICIRYPTLPGLELATCTVSSARRFHFFTVTMMPANCKHLRACSLLITIYNSTFVVLVAVSAVLS